MTFIDLTDAACTVVNEMDILLALWAALLCSYIKLPWSIVS